MKLLIEMPKIAKCLKLRYSVDFNNDGATRGAHAAQALALRERLRLRPVSLRAGSAARAIPSFVNRSAVGGSIVIFLVPACPG